MIKYIHTWAWLWVCVGCLALLLPILMIPTLLRKFQNHFLWELSLEPVHGHTRKEFSMFTSCRNHLHSSSLLSSWQGPYSSSPICLRKCNSDWILSSDSYPLATGLFRLTRLKAFHWILHGHCHEDFSYAHCSSSFLLAHKGTGWNTEKLSQQLIQVILCKWEIWCISLETEITAHSVVKGTKVADWRSLLIGY